MDIHVAPAVPFLWKPSPLDSHIIVPLSLKCALPLRLVLLFATPWTVACQSPLSMGFSRQGCGSGLPFPPPWDLPNPGTEPASPVSPALENRVFTTEPPRKSLLSLCSNMPFSVWFSLTVLVITATYTIPLHSLLPFKFNFSP